MDDGYLIYIVNFDKVKEHLVFSNEPKKLLYCKVNSDMEYWSICIYFSLTAELDLSKVKPSRKKLVYICHLILSYIRIENLYFYVI